MSCVGHPGSGRTPVERGSGFAIAISKASRAKKKRKEKYIHKNMPAFQSDKRKRKNPEFLVSAEFSDQPE